MSKDMDFVIRKKSNQQKWKKKWLHIVTKTRFGTVKATSKKVVQKVAEAT